jgi:hypothetical protein
VTDTALLFKKRSPRLYRSIRDNMPPDLRSLINEQMTVDCLGTGDAKEVFTNIFKKNWWNNDEPEWLGCGTQANGVHQDQPCRFRPPPRPRLAARCADAWLARDLMIHFPDKAIWTALEQFRRSSLSAGDDLPQCARKHRHKQRALI